MPQTTATSSATTHLSNPSSSDSTFHLLPSELRGGAIYYGVGSLEIARALKRFESQLQTAMAKCQHSIVKTALGTSASSHVFHELSQEIVEAFKQMREEMHPWGVQFTEKQPRLENVLSKLNTSAASIDIERKMAYVEQRVHQVVELNSANHAIDKFTGSALLLWSAISSVNSILESDTPLKETIHQASMLGVSFYGAAEASKWAWKRSKNPYFIFAATALGGLMGSAAGNLFSSFMLEPGSLLTGEAHAAASSFETHQHDVQENSSWRRQAQGLLSAIEDNLNLQVASFTADRLWTHYRVMKPVSYALSTVAKMPVEAVAESHFFTQANLLKTDVTREGVTDKSQRRLTKLIESKNRFQANPSKEAFNILVSNILKNIKNMRAEMPASVSVFSPSLLALRPSQMPAVAALMKKGQYAQAATLYCEEVQARLGVDYQIQTRQFLIGGALNALVLADVIATIKKSDRPLYEAGHQASRFAGFYAASRASSEMIARMTRSPTLIIVGGFAGGMLGSECGSQLYHKLPPYAQHAIDQAKEHIQQRLTDYPMFREVGSTANTLAFITGANKLYDHAMRVAMEIKSQDILGEVLKALPEKMPPGSPEYTSQNIARITALSAYGTRINEELLPELRSKLTPLGSARLPQKIDTYGNSVFRLALEEKIEEAIEALEREFRKQTGGLYPNIDRAKTAGRVLVGAALVGAAIEVMQSERPVRTSAHLATRFAASWAAATVFSQMAAPYCAATGPAVAPWCMVAAFITGGVVGDQAGERLNQVASACASLLRGTAHAVEPKPRVPQRSLFQSSAAEGASAAEERLYDALYSPELHPYPHTSIPVSRSQEVSQPQPIIEEPSDDDWQTGVLTQQRSTTLSSSAEQMLATLRASRPEGQMITAPSGALVLANLRASRSSVFSGSSRDGWCEQFNVLQQRLDTAQAELEKSTFNGIRESFCRVLTKANERAFSSPQEVLEQLVLYFQEAGVRGARLEAGKAVVRHITDSMQKIKESPAHQDEPTSLLSVVTAAYGLAQTAAQQQKYVDFFFGDTRPHGPPPSPAHFQASINHRGGGGWSFMVILPIICAPFGCSIM